MTDDALQLRALLGSLTARLPLCCLGEIQLLDAVLAVLEIVRGGGDRTWMRWPSGIWHLARPLRIATDGRVTTACDGLARPAGEPHPNPPPVERCHACWRAVCGGSVIGMALLGLVEHIAIHDRDIARRREQARDEMFPCEDDREDPGPHTHVYVGTDRGDECQVCGRLRDQFADLHDEFAPDRHLTRVASDSEVIALAEVPRDRDPDMEVEIEWDTGDIEEPIAVHGPGGGELGGEGG